MTPERSEEIGVNSKTTLSPTVINACEISDSSDLNYTTDTVPITSLGVSLGSPKVLSQEIPFISQPGQSQAPARFDDISVESNCTFITAAVDANHDTDINDYEEEISYKSGSSFDSPYEETAAVESIEELQLVNIHAVANHPTWKDTSVPVSQSLSSPSYSFIIVSSTTDHQFPSTEDMHDVLLSAPDTITTGNNASTSNAPIEEVSQIVLGDMCHGLSLVTDFPPILDTIQEACDSHDASSWKAICIKELKAFHAYDIYSLVPLFIDCRVLLVIMFIKALLPISLHYLPFWSTVS